MARTFNIATFFDPRYKELTYVDEPMRKNVIDQVQGELLMIEENPILSRNAYEQHLSTRTGQLLSNHIAVQTYRNVRRFDCEGLRQC